MKRYLFLILSLFIISAVRAQAFDDSQLLSKNQKEVLEAAKNDDFAQLQNLLKFGWQPEVNVADTIANDLRTPLLYAIENGNDEMASFLLEKGANPDKADRKGRTPLFYAMLHRRLAIFEELVGRVSLEKSANRLVLHEMVMSSDDDCFLEYIKAYFKAWHQKGHDDLDLLYSFFPGVSYDDDNAVVLEDELSASHNPRTKAFFNSLRKW